MQAWELFFSFVRLINLGRPIKNARSKPLLPLCTYLASIFSHINVELRQSPFVNQTLTRKLLTNDCFSDFLLTIWIWRRSRTTAPPLKLRAQNTMGRRNLFSTGRNVNWPFYTWNAHFKAFHFFYEVLINFAVCFLCSIPKTRFYFTELK